MNKDILNGFSLHTLKGIAIGLGAAVIAILVLPLSHRSSSITPA